MKHFFISKTKTKLIGFLKPGSNGVLWMWEDEWSSHKEATASRKEQRCGIHEHWPPRMMQSSRKVDSPPYVKQAMVLELSSTGLSGHHTVGIRQPAETSPQPSKGCWGLYTFPSQLTSTSEHPVILLRAQQTNCSTNLCAHVEHSFPAILLLMAKACMSPAFPFPTLISPKELASTLLWALRKRGGQRWLWVDETLSMKWKGGWRPNLC